MEKPLSLKAQKFVDVLLADPKLEQTAAAIVAGYSPRSAHNTASDLMQDPRVIALLAERGKARLERLELTQDDVLRDLYQVAKADPRDLTEYHIGCCRYCHGEGFKYQRTPEEYRRAWADYQTTVKGAKDPLGIDFDHAGGVGFNENSLPHPDCPECFGNGVGRTVIKDTRTLSPAAAILFAGVKQTRNGVEVMTRSKDKVIELAARHTGVVKSSLEVTGKGGGPIKTEGAIVALTTADPQEAARQYQKLMGQ